MYQKNFTNYTQKPYNPKKTVKHFTDLEVYQKALEASVFVSKNLCKNTTDETKSYILKNMTALALSIPHQIAESHSCRFGSSDQCLLILDKVMLGCNKMVVYLEQARDICETGVELSQFEEQTKKYFYIRQKVLNLQRVWRKYIEVAKLEGK
ncbi:MAG: four helix bundle protein [Candidatus Moraniibacteriota bacterium]